MPASRRRKPLTPQAGANARRRADPAKLARERLAEQARDTAIRRLLERHHDEYLITIQEERHRRSLPPLVLRRNHPIQRHLDEQPRTLQQAGARENPPVLEQAPEAALVPDAEKRAKCRHNEGLKKLPYGTFCIACGERIR